MTSDYKRLAKLQDALEDAVEASSKNSAREKSPTGTAVETFNTNSFSGMGFQAPREKTFRRNVFFCVICVLAFVSFVLAIVALTQLKTQKANFSDYKETTKTRYEEYKNDETIMEIQLQNLDEKLENLTSLVKNLNLNQNKLINNITKISLQAEQMRMGRNSTAEEIRGLSESIDEAMDTVTNLGQRLDTLKSTVTNFATEHWYKPGNGYQYIVLSGRNSWRASRRKCRAKGADLAASGIKDLSMRDKITEEILDDVRTWIGLHYQVDDEAWFFTDGTEASAEEVRWAPGEPNGVNLGEHCAEINFPDLPRFTLNDAPCFFSFAALCEKRLPANSNSGASAG